MMGRTHLLTGGVYIILSQSLPVVAVGVLLGSVLPDIDNKNSYINNKIKIIKPFLPKPTIDHRGILHNPLVLMLFLPFISNLFIQGLMIGYGLHLLLDAMTPKGIVFLKFLRKINIKTNSIQEHILRGGLLCLLIFKLL